MDHGPDRRKRVAILIDAENVSHRVLEQLFVKVGRIGDAVVRRMYGDFSKASLKCWSDAAAAHAIVPYQVFAGTTGKNASDIALVIDAMDLLHARDLDAFCILSSDGDFTGLAKRLREGGADVFGFGEAKAPTSFRAACKSFVELDAAASSVRDIVLPARPKPTASSAATSRNRPPSASIDYIQAAIAELTDTNGWYYLGAVGGRLGKMHPGFSSKTFGCDSLSALVRESRAFDMKRDGLVAYIRAKGSTDSACPPETKPLDGHGGRAGT